MSVATEPKIMKINKKDIRVGSVVETAERGLGIVVWRGKDECWVAHKRVEFYNGRRIEIAERYSYKTLNGVILSNQTVDPDSGFYKGAWNHITGEAKQDNYEWEYARSKQALQNLPKLEGVTYKKRSVSWGYGSAEYLRMTSEGVFDFEISTYPTVTIGLHELLEGMVALWNGKDYKDIKLLDYNGNFFRKQATEHDFNYGQAYGWSEADRRLAEKGYEIA